MRTMTRPIRLAIGSAIVVAVGCSVGGSVTSVAPVPVVAQDDAQRSGDSGPPVSDWRPDLREGVRHVQGGSDGR